MCKVKNADIPFVRKLPRKGQGSESKHNKRTKGEDLKKERIESRRETEGTKVSEDGVSKEQR